MKFQCVGYRRKAIQMSSVPIPKYRPYLSIPALSRILTNAMKDENPDDIDREIRRAVMPTILNYRHPDTVRPAYVTNPRPTLADRLGMTTQNHLEKAGVKTEDELDRLMEEQFNKTFAPNGWGPDGKPIK